MFVEIPEELVERRESMIDQMVELGMDRVGAEFWFVEHVQVPAVKIGADLMVLVTHLVKTGAVD